MKLSVCVDVYDHFNWKCANDFLLHDRLVRPKLYCEPYDSIQWDSTRHLVADMDNYSPIPAFMKFAQNCLSFYENWTAFRPFREYMKAEDLQTNYVDIGPVNKALNMVSAFYGTSSSEWRW